MLSSYFNHYIDSVQDSYLKTIKLEVKFPNNIIINLS